MNRITKQLISTITGGNCCFIIGNGINRYNLTSDSLSWEDILLEIHNDLSAEKRNFIPKGIALTEFYDVIDLQKRGDVKKSLQQEFADRLGFSPQAHHRRIIGIIKSLNVPVITTNFDFALEKASKSEMYRYRVPGRRALSDFYPWDTYFSSEEREDPFNSFSIWHMHGQINYQRSIKLGLNQYMLMVDRAKRLAPRRETEEDKLSYYKTWVRLFFEKDLIIFGLGLQEQEIFIRWLLLERAKYFKRNPDMARRGFFVNHEKSTEDNLGKKFFLKAAGFPYVDFIDDYSGFYDDFWTAFENLNH